MSYIVSGILIDQLPNHNRLAQFLDDDVKPSFDPKDGTNLCPENLSIGFGENSTFVFLDMIFYENIDENAALTEMEKQFCQIFPSANILVIAQNDVSDITGYSLLKNSKKLRTKFVAQGKQFLDFGELNETEQLLLKQVQEFIERKPEVKTKLLAHTNSMSALEKSKFELIYRDKLFARGTKDNKFEYLGGSLDQHIIEKLINELVGMNFSDLESIKSIVFAKSNFNFEKDKLANYIDLAFRQLNPNT